MPNFEDQDVSFRYFTACFLSNKPVFCLFSSNLTTPSVHICKSRKHSTTNICHVAVNTGVSPRKESIRSPSPSHTLTQSLISTAPLFPSSPPVHPTQIDCPSLPARLQHGQLQGRRWGSKHRGGDGLLGEQQDGAGMGLFRRGDTVVFTSSTRRGQGQARCPQRQVLILAYPSVGVPGASGDAKVTQRWSGARLRDCEGGAPGATPRPGSRRASLKDGGLQLRSGSTMPAKMLLCLLLARTQPRVGRWVMERCRNGIRRCGAPPQSVQGRPRLRKWPGRWSSLMGWGRPQLLGTN